MSEHMEGAPFSEPLESAGFLRDGEDIEHFRKLPDREDVIIRRIDLQSEGLVPLSFIRSAQETFSELREYGISLPRFQFVLGKSESGNPAAYVLTEKIEGRPAEELLGDQAIQEVLDDYFVKTIGYFGEKFRTGGLVATDIENFSNIMYGRTASDPADRIYMNDLDPILAEAPGGGRSEGSELWLSRSLGSARFSLDELEKRAGLPFLAKARQALADLVRETGVEPVWEED